MSPALTRRLYVSAWLTLGAIASGYFYVLFLSLSDPETSQLPGNLFARMESKATTGSSAKSTDPSLTQALARMRGEIDRLKGSLEATNKENTALKAHIATLEKAFGPTTAALPRPTEKPEPAITRTKQAASTTTEPGIDITLLPMPADGFADDFPSAPLPIAGQSEPRKTQFAVELARGLKADAINKRWSEINKRYGKMLDKLQPRGIAGTHGNDAEYTLVAGPFENAAAAARLCARMSAAGAKCQGTIFSGSPLDKLAAR